MVDHQPLAGDVAPGAIPRYLVPALTTNTGGGILSVERSPSREDVLDVACGKPRVGPLCEQACGDGRLARQADGAYRRCREQGAESQMFDLLRPGRRMTACLFGLHEPSGVVTNIVQDQAFAGGASRKSRARRASSTLAMRAEF